MQKQPVELIGNGKNHMKITYRQQILLTVFYPGFPLGILAFGTMTVTAAVVADTYMSAPVTGIYMTTQG
jgi:hypothetical protein